MKQEKIALYPNESNNQSPYEIFYLTIGLIISQLAALIVLFF